MATPEPPRNSPAKRLFLIAFVALTLGVAGVSVWSNLTRWHSSDEARAQSGGPQAANALTIVSGQGRHVFAVDVMRTDAERAKGLMFRQSMPRDYGMLFDFERDQPVSMWMKNTYIPLDMVFILKDGAIHRIAQRTEPLSERTISSGAPVRAVLELNAGVAEALGLKPGDRVLHPMFPAK